MTVVTEIPNQAAFRVTPIETIAAVAPRTVIYAPGGTRAEEIRGIFGEDVPLITLYCSVGKPDISPDLFLSHLDSHFYEI